MCRLSNQRLPLRVTLDGSIVSRQISNQNQIKSLSSSTTNLNYDADGNTVNDQNGQQYKYNAWNRLVKVTTPGGDTMHIRRHAGQQQLSVECHIPRRVEAER